MFQYKPNAHFNSVLSKSQNYYFILMLQLISYISVPESQHFGFLLQPPGIPPSKEPQFARGVLK